MLEKNESLGYYLSQPKILNLSEHFFSPQIGTQDVYKSV